MHKQVLFITVFCLLTMGNHTFAHRNKPTNSTKAEYLYPSNKEKIVNETVDQFYEALRNRSYPIHQEFFKTHVEFYKRYKNKMGNMDTALFKEIPDASVNIRKKLLFNEVGEFYYLIWDGNGFLNRYPDLYMEYNHAVSPDRQVYFFNSFKDTDNNFYGRFAIYDVETKQLVTGGDFYIDKNLKPGK